MSETFITFTNDSLKSVGRPIATLKQLDEVASEFGETAARSGTHKTDSQMDIKRN